MARIFELNRLNWGRNLHLCCRRGEYAAYTYAGSSPHFTCVVDVVKER